MEQKIHSDQKSFKNKLKIIGRLISMFPIRINSQKFVKKLIQQMKTDTDTKTLNKIRKFAKEQNKQMKTDTDFQILCKIQKFKKNQNKQWKSDME